MRVLVCALLCLLCARNSFAVCSWSGNTGTAASADSADINDCKSDASAMAGAIVIQIPDGTPTWSSGVSSTPSYPPTDQGVRLEQLKTLTALRDSGALTVAEFDAEKRRILNG